MIGALLRLPRQLAVDALANALSAETEPKVIEVIVWCLSRLGRHAAPAIPQLVNVVRDPNSYREEPRIAAFGHRSTIGESAIRTLVAIGPSAAVPLARVIADADESATIRCNAGWGLAHMRTDATPALPILIRVLSDPDEEIRGYAVDTIGGIGPKAREAVPAIETALGDKNAFVRVQAAAALSKVSPRNSKSVSHLILSLNDKDRHIRWLAATHLGELGPDARIAVDVFVAMLAEDELDNRVAYIRALGRIGTDAKRTVAVLEKLASDEENEYVRREAAAALLLIKAK
jgi:HEAT repeat protein